MRLEIILIFANNLLMKTLKLFTAHLFYVKDNLHMKKKLVELSLFREELWNYPPKRLNTHAVKKTKHKIISHASIKFLKGSSWTDPGWRITHPKLRTPYISKNKSLKKVNRETKLNEFDNVKTG